MSQIRRPLAPARTKGPFFGVSFGDQSELDDDLAFIAKARSAIADGETIFYWSWW